MRKKWVTILLIVFLGVSGIKIIKASAQAELRWNVAPRLWFATWKDDGIGDDDSTMMYGISGSVTINDKFDIGLSILTGNFNFESAGLSLSTDRFDTDIYFSYKIKNPYLNLSVGYKMLSYKYNIKGTTYDWYYGYYPINENEDIDITGFGLGASGCFPITQGFNGYYTASYLPLLEADLHEFGKEDISSFNIEIGGGYTIDKRITLSLGYKYQKFFGWGADGGDDTISGLTSSVIFSF